MKRVLEATAAAFLLLVLAPLLLALFVLVRIKLGKPALFRQERTGRAGHSFQLIKFRTMRDLRDADGELLEDSLRTPKFGRFLRTTSLDELPELWNIFRGEMSFIGPRPLLPRYLPWYTEREATRHQVRPGLTGLSQVSGRSRLTWDEQLELDARYVEEYSLVLDCKIFLLTLAKVFHTRHAETVSGKQRVALDVERGTVDRGAVDHRVPATP